MEVAPYMVIKVFTLLLFLLSFLNLLHYFVLMVAPVPFLYCTKRKGNDQCLICVCSIIVDNTLEKSPHFQFNILMYETHSIFTLLHWQTAKKKILWASRHFNIVCESFTKHNCNLNFYFDSLCFSVCKTMKITCLDWSVHTHTLKQLLLHNGTFVFRNRSAFRVKDGKEGVFLLLSVFSGVLRFPLDIDFYQWKHSNGL